MRLAFLSVFCFLSFVQAETKIADFQKVPLAFENSGTNSFIARSRGRTVQVGAGELRLGGAIIVFSGAKDSRGRASDELPGKVNLIQGNDATKWKMGLATYGRVTYSETYSGIDVVYYGDQQKLEFDFVVKSGADKLSLRPDGSLTIGSKLTLALPIIYQQIDGKQRDIPSRFGRCDAVDGNGAVWATGFAYSADFPTQSKLAGISYAFVFKLNSSGALRFSTYLGGSTDSTSFTPRGQGHGDGGGCGEIFNRGTHTATAGKRTIVVTTGSSPYFRTA